MVRERVLVVGGGILGTMHALSALDRGMEVVHLERERAPRGASVRNFGLIWVSGRAPGDELELALRSRSRWGAVASRITGLDLRENGSLTVARTDPERRVIEAAASGPDAARRGLTFLEPAEVRRLNPAVTGEMLGALFCATDAVVEPRRALGALRAGCEATGRYRWLAGREVIDITGGGLTDDSGDVHGGDRIVLCPGAWHHGVMGEVLEGAPLGRVRLQMLETEPSDLELTTSIADGDSLRYYPAFDGEERNHLEPQDPVAAAWAAQLLMVQRIDGSLTIGDTHSFDEPFAFDLDETPTRHLLTSAASVLGRPVPPVARRWAGVYSQLTGAAGEAPYLRLPVGDGVQVVTGPGGRGMTLAPGIAEETFA